MSYTSFDHAIARLRFRVAVPHVRSGARVCDIGCGLSAHFLRFARQQISFGVGIDTQVLVAPMGMPLVRGDISRGLPFKEGQFDNAVMLAVLEHLSDPSPLFVDVFRILAPGGSLIMTWPQALIDPILHVLHAVGLISKEMESDKHQARIPPSKLLPMLADIGFIKPQHRRFECGLNNLLVCYKPA